jgi:hypothetical protein
MIGLSDALASVKPHPFSSFQRDDERAEVLAKALDCGLEGFLFIRCLLFRQELDPFGGERPMHPGRGPFRAGKMNA